MKPLANFGISFLVEAGSGFPYTPQLGLAEEFWRVVVNTNSARRPWTIRVDMRAEKSLNIEGLTLTTYVKITNLLDRRNVLFVYPRTGKPWDAGPQYRGSEEFLKDPSVFDAPRQIRLGFSVSK